MPQLRRRKPRAEGHGTHLRSSLANAALAVEDRVVLGAGPLPRRGRGRQVALREDRLGGRAQARLADRRAHRGLEWPGPRRRPRRRPPARRRRRRRGRRRLRRLRQRRLRRGRDRPGGRPCRCAEPAAAAGRGQGRRTDGARPARRQARLQPGVRRRRAAVLKGRSHRRREGGRRDREGQPQLHLRHFKENAAVAGPAAIEVARKFADAFVLYETGRTNAQVRSVFGQRPPPISPRPC